MLGGPDGRLATFSAAILTGGAPAAAAAVPAATQNTARLLGELFQEVLAVGSGPVPEGATRAVPDLSGPACPLRGVVSALAAASGERVLVLAGDGPRVPEPRADLLLALVAWPEADAVVLRTAHGLEPLCAIYRRDPVLRVARGRLAAGKLALHDLLAEVETRVLDETALPSLEANRDEP